MPKNLQDLRNKVKEFSTVLPCMEGRDKGSTDGLYETTVTLIDYGFLKDENSEEYAVFIIKEEPQYFYFGGLVLTEHLKQLDEDGYHETILEEGLPLKLTKRKSKNKREYTNVEYYPNED